MTSQVAKDIINARVITMVQTMLALPDKEREEQVIAAGCYFFRKAGPILAAAVKDRPTDDDLSMAMTCVLLSLYFKCEGDFAEMLKCAHLAMKFMQDLP